MNSKTAEYMNIEPQKFKNGALSAHIEIRAEHVILHFCGSCIHVFYYSAVLLLCIVSIFLIGCSKGPEETAGTGSGWETPTVAISGKAVYANGDPAARAEVLLRSQDFLKQVTGLTKRTADKMEVFTDKSGNFRMDSVDIGAYFIEINDGNGQAALIDINAEEDVVLPDKALAATAYISGMVEGPVPLKNVYVQIYGLDRIALVDSITGEYRFTDLPAGEYTLRIVAIASDYGVKEVETSLLAPSDSVTVDSIRLVTFQEEDYSDWNQSIDITINTAAGGANVTQDILNFPLLVRLDQYPTVFNTAHAKGQDIRFSKSDGTHLPYEIERWEPDSSRAVVWVLMDTVQGGSSQTITMHWGNPDALDFSNGTSVFDTAAGFAGVWHLGEDGNVQDYGYRDATANEAHGKGVRFSKQSDVEGLAGKCQLFDGFENFIKISKEHVFDMTNAITVSVWTKINNYDKEYQALITKGDYAWRLHRSGGGNAIRWARTNGGQIKGVTGEININDGVWHLITAVYDARRLSIYVDSELDVTLEATGPIDNTTEEVWIGNNSGAANRYWDGLIDEVRISGTARSEAWIRLSYENQRENSNVVNFQ